jgi:hypothetical protein
MLFLENDYSYRSYDIVPVPIDNVLRTEDVRIANRIGARMSGTEIDAILERRELVEAALSRIPFDASLADSEDAVPWEAITELFAAMSGIHGVGLAKTTKALHKKRPLLIPMLDSVVAGYLYSVDSIPPASAREHATALVRSYKRDLDRNVESLECVRAELEKAGYQLTLCRILDLYTWAYAGANAPPWATDALAASKAKTNGDEETEELAADLGLAATASTYALLSAAIREVGYVQARREIRRWLSHRDSQIF